MATLKNNIEKAGEYINAAKAALNSFVRPENPCPEVAAQRNETVAFCSSGEVSNDVAEYKNEISSKMIECLTDLHSGVKINFNKDALKYLNREIILHTEYKYYRLSKPTPHAGTNNWRILEQKGPATSIYTKIHATLNIDDNNNGVIVIRKSDGFYKGNIVSRLSGGGSAHEYIFVLEESKIPFESAGNPELHNNAGIKEAEKQRNNALKELEKARTNLAVAKSSGINSAALEAAQKNAANARSELNVLKANAASKNAASAATLEKALQNVESARGELAAAKQQAEELRAALNKQHNNAAASTNAMKTLNAARQASLNQTRRVAANQNMQQGLLSSVINTRTAAEKAQAVGRVSASQDEYAALRSNPKFATWKHCVDKWRPNNNNSIKKIKNGEGMCSDNWARKADLPLITKEMLTQYKTRKGGRRQTQKQRKQRKQSKARQQH